MSLSSRSGTAGTYIETNDNLGRPAAQGALKDLEETGILNRDQAALRRRIYRLGAETLAAIQPLAPAAKTPEAAGFHPGGEGFGGGGATGGY